MWYDVHQVDVHEPGAATYDDEGRHTRSWTTVSVQGRMTGGSEAEAAQFAQRGITLDGVALVPSDTVVDTTYEVSCDITDPIYSLETVRYRVVEVRPNLSHIRLMLTRTPPRG